MPLIGGGWLLAERLLAPRALPSTARLDLGEARLGELAESRTVTLTNDGRRPLTVEEARLTGTDTDEFTIASESCIGVALERGDSCVVELAFTAAVEGGRAARLELHGNAPDSPTVVELAGAGVVPALAVDPEAIDFGVQPAGTTGPASTVRVLNSGTGTLQVEQARLTGGAAAEFDLDAASCEGVALGAGESCAVSIAFSPRAAGRRVAGLRVTSDVENGDLTVGLGGEGAAAALAVSASRLELGGVRVGRESQGRSVQVSNRGNLPLEIGAVELVGEDRAAFTAAVADCAGRTLAPGEACTLEARFRPRRAGDHRAAIAVRSPVLNGAHQIPLAGRGTAPGIELETDTLDFGSAVEGDGVERTLTVTSTGDAPLAIGGARAEGGDFSVAPGRCAGGGTLPPGQTCALTLRFVPRAPGARNGRLVVGHDAAGGSSAVELSGTGLPRPLPEIRVEPAQLDFGSRLVGERSGIESLTVRNAGSARLDLGGIELAGSHPGDFRMIPASCEGLPYLSPGGYCTIGFRFEPTVAGPRRAELRIRHGGPGGVARVALGGRGEVSSYP